MTSKPKRPRGRPRGPRQPPSTLFGEKDGQDGGETRILQRIKGRRPNTITDDPALDAEYRALVAAGAAPSVITALYRQARILQKAATLRLRIDEIRRRVQRAWDLNGFAGVPPLANITSQGGAAKTLCDAGASRDVLIEALGISTGLAGNYRSRASSTKPSTRIDMARQAPTDELSLGDLQAEMRHLIARCKEHKAYMCALAVSELLTRTLEAGRDLQPSPPTPSSTRDDPTDSENDIGEMTLDQLCDLMEGFPVPTRPRGDPGVER